jgi:hypothetical protein
VCLLAITTLGKFSIVALKKFYMVKTRELDLIHAIVNIVSDLVACYDFTSIKGPTLVSHIKPPTTLVDHTQRWHGTPLQKDLRFLIESYIGVPMLTHTHGFWVGMGAMLLFIGGHAWVGIGFVHLFS